jgi:hypothetical protein
MAQVMLAYWQVLGPAQTLDTSPHGISVACQTQFWTMRRSFRYSTHIEFGQVFFPGAEWPLDCQLSLSWS